MIFLMGAFKDKQYDKIAEILAPVADTVIAMETPDNPRALPAKQLAETVSAYNDRVLIAKSLEQAVELGFQTAKPEDVIVAFGSLSFIGDLTKIVSKEDNRKDI